MKGCNFLEFFLRANGCNWNNILHYITTNLHQFTTCSDYDGTIVLIDDTSGQIVTMMGLLTWCLEMSRSVHGCVWAQLHQDRGVVHVVTECSTMIQTEGEPVIWNSKQPTLSGYSYYKLIQITYDMFIYFPDVCSFLHQSLLDPEATSASPWSRPWKARRGLDWPQLVPARPDPRRWTGRIWRSRSVPRWRIGPWKIGQPVNLGCNPPSLGGLKFVIFHWFLSIKNADPMIK